MNALTKNEREGLDEVFLSIHTNINKYQKFKALSTLIMQHTSPSKFKNFFKVANYGLKETKLVHFLGQLHKKKKNLSK